MTQNKNVIFDDLTYYVHLKKTNHYLIRIRLSMGFSASFGISQMVAIFTAPGIRPPVQ